MRVRQLILKEISRRLISLIDSSEIKEWLAEIPELGDFLSPLPNPSDYPDPDDHGGNGGNNNNNDNNNNDDDDDDDDDDDNDNGGGYPN